MKRTIKIARPANGTGTTVTVTLLEDGITATFGYKTTATAIGTAIRYATKAATDMLKQARAEIDSEES